MLSSYADLSTEKLQELMIRTHQMQNSVSVLGLKAKEFDELIELDGACRSVSEEVSKELRSRLGVQEYQEFLNALPSVEEDSVLVD